MIKSNKGKVELKDDISSILAELTTACRAIKEAIVDEGGNEEEAKASLQRCLDLAFMSKEEIVQEVKRAIEEMISKGLV